MAKWVAAIQPYNYDEPFQPESFQVPGTFDGQPAVITFTLIQPDKCDAEDEAGEERGTRDGYDHSITMADWRKGGPDAAKGIYHYDPMT